MTEQERQAGTPRPPRQAAPEAALDGVSETTVDLSTAAASVTAQGPASGPVTSGDAATATGDARTSGDAAAPGGGDPDHGEAATPRDPACVTATATATAASGDAPAAAPSSGDAPASVDMASSVDAAASPEAADRGARDRRFPRLTGAGAMIAVLLAGLGFTLVIQVRNVSDDPTLSAARQEDLVRILSDLQAREQRLNGDIADLEESQRELANGVRGNQAALEEARERADELGILAGTLPATGTGLRVHFRGNVDQIKARQVLDAVQELRGAGAEAMQIAGGADDTNPVRIIASTYFLDSRDGIDVGGILLTAPYTISVIGDPKTMRTALNIPGGVVEAVAQSGGTVTMDELDAVTVTAQHGEISLEYARPVP